MGPRGKQGRRKADYRLEEMDQTEKSLVDALGLAEEYLKHPKLEGLGACTPQ